MSTFTLCSLVFLIIGLGTQSSVSYAKSCGANEEFCKLEAFTSKTWNLENVDPVTEGGKCVMGGNCGFNENVGRIVPCSNTSDPYEVENIGLLRDLCPDQFNGENTKVCCSGEQLEEMKTSFALAAMAGLNRCPSCYSNFRKLICNFVCSPKQNEMVRVTGEDKLQDGRVAVKEIEYYVQESYILQLFDSCKEVKRPMDGEPALTLVCMDIDCTPRKWMDFVGRTSDEGGYSPIKLNIIFANESKVQTDNQTMIPMNAKVHSCAESPGDGLLPCSCSDCNQVCQPPTNYFKSVATIEEEETNFYGISGTIVSFLAVSVILLNICGPIIQIISTQDSVEGDDEEDITDNQVSNLEELIEQYFNFWAHFVARNSYATIGVALAVSVFLSCGIYFSEVTTDPVDLWVSPSSKARQDMDYFNENFGRFYRVEQVIASPTNKDYFNATYDSTNETMTFGPVFGQAFLRTVFRLQKQIEELTANSEDGREIKLQDICTKPMGTVCATQSVFTYFLNSEEKLNASNYLQQLVHCIKNPAAKQCFEKDGIPLLYPRVGYGGFPKEDYFKSSSIIITFPVVNHNEKVKNKDAELWEEKFLELLHNFSDPTVEIAYKAERSIEDELDRQSRADVMTVVFSYLIMFFYVLFALGRIRNCSDIFVDGRFTLGFAGVVVVIMSVLSSFGLFFFFKVPATLIIMEVIPFLVLAVGIDNVFILVQRFDQEEKTEDEGHNEYFARVVSQVGPSMFLSSLSMSSCFFIGALTPMPAVQKFALYAAVALVVNFFLQMTLFLAILYLDMRRIQSKRLDVFCCLKTKPGRKRVEKFSVLHTFFSEFYAPVLMKQTTRIVVIAVFSLWLTLSLIFMSKITIGLDQELSMPDDSYMTKYFEYYTKYLQVGPPVYFMITEGFNYSNVRARDKLCAAITKGEQSFCDPDSMMQSLNYLVKEHSERIYLSSLSQSWFDNYAQYLVSDDCCKVYPNGSQFIPSEESQTCRRCEKCWDEGIFPEGNAFNKHIPYFLRQNADEKCILGGRQLFSEAVKLWQLNETVDIGATYVMGYRTPLKTSEDFYKSLRWSRYIAERLTMKIQSNGTSNAEVRVYSYPDVFYEQYLTIWRDTAISLGLSLGTIFLVTLLFLGFDFGSAAIVTFMITAIVVNLMGLMYLWDITLNAVSLVNLVVCVGISVEFCSHIVKTYTTSRESTRLNKAEDALAKMGASVLSGITLTDFGILVFVLAKSKIFKIFYFRMYIGIIVIGTLHSLLFLPALLSVIGPVKKQRLNATRQLTLNNGQETQL